ncbi:peptide ligase PGM1-related protein [Micromonospora sp. LOL_024]|uniref:preATP grasp domain-containing protein n=1 Tax=Micromonospora sp. LOL_024 TaxID=3345412 RepID=UPI003A88FEB2
MTRLLIGNDFSEDVRTDRGWTGWWVQRLVWFAEDDDVLVLPTAPEEAFVRYVTSLTGTRPESLRFVVLPAGPADGGTLSAARLVDEKLVAATAKAIDGREVETVFALWPDAAVARLTRSLGIATALPGYGFVDQAGGTMVNSKSAFRTIASGVGVPLPPGAVCTSRDVAETTIVELLNRYRQVIIKHDFLSGGHGNEILSTEPGVRPIGARRTVTVDGRPDVRAYLDDRWEWLTSGSRSRPVVERYVRDSSAFFAEVSITDEGIHTQGTGELLSAPYAIGQVMPALGLEPEVLDTLVSATHRLCEPLRAMGYRGLLAADAIVTPQREVLFTEYNGRVTGSTHIYGRIGRKVVGDGYGTDRTILERVWPEDWSVPSFSAALERVTAAGLAYDPATRAGVVFTNAFDNVKGVMYCIVMPTVDEAWQVEQSLKPVFGSDAGTVDA